jgi:hypothetical protein
LILKWLKFQPIDFKKTFSGLSLSANPESGHKKTGYPTVAGFFGIARACAGLWGYVGFSISERFHRGGYSIAGFLNFPAFRSRQN